jgi:SAM-dependent methyltransferase
MSSSSLRNPDYWWYRARALLLQRGLAGSMTTNDFVLDVGSADGPSVDWLGADHRVISLDIDRAGLSPGGVCGSALALPFAGETFDVVSAFDVIEHFEDDAAVLREMRRVVRTGGRILVSVPAYQWAWSAHDESAGHYRRYTRRHLVSVLAKAGLRLDRATYAFAATFPFFAGDRLLGRLRGSVHRPTDAALPAPVERALLAMTRLDAAAMSVLDLPFGSSLLASAYRVA